MIEISVIPDARDLLFFNGAVEFLKISIGNVPILSKWLFGVISHRL
jgi:hypothetical protein